MIAVHKSMESGCSQKCHDPTNSNKDREGDTYDIVTVHFDGTSVRDADSVLEKIKKPCRVHLCGGVADRNGEGERICGKIYESIARYCSHKTPHTGTVGCLDCEDIEIVDEFLGPSNTTEEGGAVIGGLCIDSKTLLINEWQRNQNTIIPMKELRSARMYCREYASGRSTTEEREEQERKGEEDINGDDIHTWQTSTFHHLYSVLTYDAGRQQHILQFNPFHLKDLYEEQLVYYAKYCIQLLHRKGREAFLLQTSTTPSGEPYFFCDEMQKTFEFILKLNDDKMKDDNKMMMTNLSNPSYHHHHHHHHHQFGYNGNESIQFHYNYEESQWCRDALNAVSSC